ncbi:hypothetical protein K8R20_00620 [bacterium]|nr:hypothetical protein [bacterium]
MRNFDDNRVEGDSSSESIDGRSQLAEALSDQMGVVIDLNKSVLELDEARGHVGPTVSRRDEAIGNVVEIARQLSSHIIQQEDSLYLMEHLDQIDILDQINKGLGECEGVNVREILMEVVVCQYGEYLKDSGIEGGISYLEAFPFVGKFGIEMQDILRQLIKKTAEVMKEMYE